ncbi:hypothetical protein EPA93_30425 [Ktedonosporobacter rubrisoli]|uniref:Uncharacterized protein n=1 Tax=Ktedonosporobacter rubrisoli TaxID=2509675 RepID=A0A4P6JWI7_KTERU|nr:hypothetical protein [Ktedonosporobacter rubrisoli]QBD80067.1 hypothetical protein EPA93_30425 [Ktedonosporobacter rubrisoli]
MSTHPLSSDPAQNKNVSILSAGLLLRILAGGIAAAIILTAFGLLTSSGHGAAFLLQKIIVNLVSGLLYVAVMAPLAISLPLRWPARFGAIFVPLYVTGVLADLVEAYFYTTTLTPFKLVMALIFESIPFLLIALVIAWLLPPSSKARSRPGLRQRALLSWLWRIVLVGILYVPTYYLFATLVTPIEHIFYHDPSFVAQLHTQVPPASVTIILEAFRGVFFALAMLPVLAVMDGPSWPLLLYLTLIGVVIEAWVPLLGQANWPWAMRLGNMLELTGDALGRGIAITLLLALPATFKRRKETEAG